MAAIHLHEKTWSVARGGAPERICGELVGEETQSYFSLCSLFTGGGVVRQRYGGASGPLQVSGSVQRRHGGRVGGVGWRVSAWCFSPDKLKRIQTASTRLYENSQTCEDPDR